MMKPIIGITSDRDNAQDNIESHYCVRRNYCAAVAASGGVPVVLPYDAASADEHLALLDGLLITGGTFDVAPEEYGMQAKYPDKIVMKPDRTQFEQALLRGAFARDIPILGICGGMQLIAIEMGAKLHQHIPSDVDTAIEHKQSEPCNIAAHAIRILPGTQLHRLMGTDSLRVNSLHHQAVAGGNSRLRIAAVSDDGVVESIEVPEREFCIGVQWHPEYLLNEGGRNLFAELVRVASKRRGGTGQKQGNRSSS
ncbi:MAG TPA: gamma-glutamyl-gamma-aminobutyrate hydrolase family protein [Noviherbaspirillum sp.]|nr:gamma-glutamyl-gamma-aminobutyrate hydrolase family protein [Noviherbaspirillum sp.]